MKPLLTNVGDRYDKLSVVEKKEHKYVCKCDCGKTVLKSGQSLRTYKHLSCGCELNKHRRLPDGESAFRALLAAYIKRASRDGIEWGLDSDTFRGLTEGNCTYCGQPPSQVCAAHKRSNGTYTYSGIDRINPTKGYVPGNVTPCCKICNYAKLRMSVGEFSEWVVKVYNNFASRI